MKIVVGTKMARMISRPMIIQKLLANLQAKNSKQQLKLSFLTIKILHRLLGSGTLVKIVR